MKQIIDRYTPHYLAAVFFSIAASVFLALFSVKLGAVVDLIIQPEGNLYDRILLCIGLIFLWFLASMIFGFIKVRYSYHILRDLKIPIYKALYRKDIGEFLSESGETYLNTMTRDMDLLNQNYLIPKCNVVSNIIYAVVSIASIFIIEWRLGIAFVLVSLLTIVLSQMPGVIMAKKTDEFSKESGVYLGKVNNFLKGFEQIKLLTVSGLFADKFDLADKSFETTREKYSFTTAAAENFGMFFSFFAQLLCLSIGIWFVLNKILTVGRLISAINLLNGVFSPLQSFVQNKNLMKTVDKITERIDLILQHEDKRGELLESKISSMTLDKVNLNFEGKEIFKDYSVNFQADKRYAIIGDSGKGKSTMIKLFLKYFMPDDIKGEVRINDKEVNGIDTEFLYKKVGFIQKNDFLIEGTVEENISLCRPISSERLSELCKHLNFQDAFLKKQIEPMDKQQVSTGEKQRIDIARFLVNDYDVLIFDEPTSNLDPKASERIYDFILGIKGKIVIVITHDREESLLSRFDEVISL